VGPSLIYVGIEEGDPDGENDNYHPKVILLHEQ